MRALEAAFRRGGERSSFRLVHYSLQSDHAHLVVEAPSPEALGRGMKSLAARFARAANRALGRSGRVLAERYPLRVLRTPREVDPASSGAWFDGWSRRVVPDTGPCVGAGLLPGVTPAAAVPGTWLLRVGWRRHGLIDPAEVPGGRRR